MKEVIGLSGEVVQYVKPVEPEPVVKKRPGRPRINKEPPNIKKDGVLSTYDERYAMYTTHCDPATFTKMVTFFKSISCSELEFAFEKDYYTIRGISHDNKTAAKVLIEGKSMVNYFCREPFTAIIKRDSLDCVMNCGDAKSIVLHSLNESVKSSIGFTMVNHKGLEKIHTLALYSKTLSDDIIDHIEDELDNSDYDVTLVIDVKKIKEMTYEIKGGLHTPLYILFTKEKDANLCIHSDFGQNHSVKSVFTSDAQYNIFHNGNTLMKRIKANDMKQLASLQSFDKNLKIHLSNDYYLKAVCTLEESDFLMTVITDTTVDT